MHNIDKVPDVVISASLDHLSSTDCVALERLADEQNAAARAKKRIPCKALRVSRGDHGLDIVFPPVYDSDSWETFGVRGGSTGVELMAEGRSFLCHMARRCRVLELDEDGLWIHPWPVFPK